MWWRPSGQRLTALEVQQSRPPDAEQDRRPARLAGPPDYRPNDIQGLGFGPRHSPFRPGDAGLEQNLSAPLRAIQIQERLQFAKPPVVLERQAATPQRTPAQ